MTRAGRGKVVAMAQHPRRANAPQSPRSVRRARRAGRTLTEQLIVLTVTGLLLALSVAGGIPLFDAFAVETASEEIVDLFGTAREYAQARQTLTAVRIDAAQRRLTVHTGTDTLARTILPDGLTMRTTRDSLAYAPSGLGYGAANLRVIVSRGRSADTITVSRLGRVARN